ncbi:MAG: DUF421 domain-containing protein [Jiangellaceae bacterium]
MDVIIRATLVFALLWFVLRVSGKRQVTQLTAFELILLVTLGDLISQTVMQEDLSLTGGALAVATFTLLSILLSWVSWRFEPTRPVLDGESTILLRDGNVDEDVLRYERLPLDDLLAAAREHGVRDLADVDLVVLESDGTFSFFTRSGGGEEQRRPVERME